MGKPLKALNSSYERHCSKCDKVFPLTEEFFYRKGKGFQYNHKDCFRKETRKHNKDRRDRAKWRVPSEA